MPTNNDWASDIAGVPRNTKTNNQLFEIIAENGGGGSGGAGFESQTLTEDVTIQQNQHYVNFNNESPDGTGGLNISTRSTEVGNTFGTRVDFQSTSLQVVQYRGDVDAPDSQAMLRVDGSGVVLSAYDQTGANSLVMDKSNFYLGNYPDTRDDVTGNLYPNNYLYTDSSGALKSAPLTLSGPTENRPDVSFAGVMYFDTTINKPIWSLIAGAGWVDATGTAV